MYDALNRRSRFKRIPSGRKIRLQERDFEVFRWLYRYRFLSSDELAVAVQPTNKKKFIERLGHLYHDGGYIDRPPQQWNSCNARYSSTVYELAARGRDTLYELDEELHRAVPFAGFGKKDILQFAHAREIVEVLLNIEIGAKKSGNRRFVSQDEILAKASERLGKTISRVVLAAGDTATVPDAFFAQEYINGEKKTYRFYALELERTNPLRRSKLDKSSFRKKHVSYSQIIMQQTYKQSLGIPNLIVIIACNDEKKLRAMIRMAEDHLEPKLRAHFLFRPLPALGGGFVKVGEEWPKHFDTAVGVRGE